MHDEQGIPPFPSFYDEHRALVHRFLVASVGPLDAEDCFQETFLAALRAYPNLRNGDNLRGWILAIAANKAVDVGRDRARRPIAVAHPEDPADGAGGTAFAGRRGADPVRGGDRIDTNDPLWTAVRDLPERMRTAVVLRHVLDRPYAEVAAAMGGTEDAARANVHQGLKRLRASLATAAMGGEA